MFFLIKVNLVVRKGGEYMAKKVAVVVGAGKGMGVNIAKVFGQHDFTVALIARKLEKLNPLVDELKSLGIEA